MKFRNERHEDAFAEAVMSYPGKDRNFIAVLYLLTADKELWTLAKRVADGEEIHFESIEDKKLSAPAYVYFCCARELYQDTGYITIKDLTGKAAFNAERLDLLIMAIHIARNGIEVVNTNR